MRAIVLLILAMLLPAGPALAQATERTVYASVWTGTTPPSPGSPSASSSCVRTTRPAKCCARRLPQNRCTLQYWSTRARRWKSTCSTCARRCAASSSRWRASTRSRSSAWESAPLFSPTIRVMPRAWRRQSDRSSRARAAAPTSSTPLSRPQMACRNERLRVRTSSSMPRRVPSSASGPTNRWSTHFGSRVRRCIR